MKELLYKMFEHKNLSREEAREVLLNISDGKYNECQLSAFMTVFLMRSITIGRFPGGYFGKASQCPSRRRRGD